MEKDNQVTAGGSAADNGFIDRIGVFQEASAALLDSDSFGATRPLSKNGAAIVPKSTFCHPHIDSVRNVGRHKQRPRVLVIERNVDLHGYFKRFLEDRYEVRMAVTGLAALDAVLSDPPELLLADLRTLQCGGSVLLHALKGNAKLHYIPLILMAVRSEKKTCIDELSAGVDDYLIKPISARRLMTCVAAHIELAKVRREAAQALSESEAKYKTLLDSLDDGVFVAHDGRFAFANPALSALLGYTDEECIGLPFQSVVAPEDLSLWGERFLPGGAGLESPWRCEGAFLHRDGHRVSVELCLRRVYFNRHSAILGIVRDITRRKQLEAAQSRLIRMIEASQDFVGLAEPDGKLIYVNCAGQRMLGFHDQEGLVSTAIGDHLSPGMKQRILDEGIPAALREGAWTGETALLARDGSEIPVSQMILAHRGADGSVEYLSTVCRDISDHRKAEQALREADRLKDEFVAMLAHELRNPLAPIRNAVQVLRQLGLTDPELKWTRDVIGRQVAQMSRLLDDLLDISRITRGTIVLKKTVVEISTVVERAVETSLPLIKSRRHGLTVDVPREPVQVEGDLTRLVQVVANLLNNAAKYTDAGGSIDLIVEASPHEAVVRVRDNGMGIPAELLPNIFELFTQGSRSLDRSQGGLGLGLALVRRLIEMHGGRVEAQSAGTGSGAEFIVHLPRIAAAPVQDDSGAAGGESPSKSAGVRVLVVDDNVDSAESMALLLSLDGHDVRTAFDGPDALKVAAAFQPEAVLLDIGLPGMDGYEVAKQMRALPGLQKALMIAVTGYGQADDRARSKAAGFDHHLVKPVDPEILSALLASLKTG